MTIDPNESVDRPVVVCDACALYSITMADLLLTINLKDFPQQTLAAWNLTAKHPDDFTTDLLRTDQEAVVAVVREMRARRKRPPISAEDFLAQLERQGLKKFVAELRNIGAEI